MFIQDESIQTNFDFAKNKNEIVIHCVNKESIRNVTILFKYTIYGKWIIQCQKHRQKTIEKQT